MASKWNRPCILQQPSHEYACCNSILPPSPSSYTLPTQGSLWAAVKVCATLKQHLSVHAFTHARRASRYMCSDAVGPQCNTDAKFHACVLKCS
jgi:hypothetical protein